MGVLEQLAGQVGGRLARLGAALGRARGVDQLDRAEQADQEQQHRHHRLDQREAGLAAQADGSESPERAKSDGRQHLERYRR